MRKLKSNNPLVFLLVAAITICSPIFGVSCDINKQDSDRIGVIVSILPQAEFVEAVGGDKVKVTVMIPPGGSPHTYEPSPQQMVALSEADIYAKVGSGIEFELSWMENLIAQNSSMLVIDCSEGVHLIEAEHHDHNGNHTHSHETTDPHIWMSILNVKIMLQNIYDGMVQLDPDNEAYYKNNLENYLDDLETLHQEFISGFSNVDNPVFMIYHPSMYYFARDYGLVQLPVETDGKEPTIDGMAKVIQQAKEHNVKVIFTSPQFNQENARVIAFEIGGTVASLDPLVREYTQNMGNVFESMIDAMNST